MAVPLLVGRRPELNPLIVEFVSCAGMHGDANVDWVALWFPWVTVGEKRIGVSDRHEERLGRSYSGSRRSSP